MDHYLLLRNNKQSGPHSIEELVAMGLRPYDLVWVDGKSAAWRYPGEVPELKPHAPEVPEQPFDRFFRRPITDKPTLSGNEIEFGKAVSTDQDIPTLTQFMQDRVRFDFNEVGESSDATPIEPQKDPQSDVPRYVSVNLPAREVRAPVAVLFPERDPNAIPRKPPRQSIPWIQYMAVLVGILSFTGLGVLIGMKWSGNHAGLSNGRPPVQVGGNNSIHPTSESRVVVSGVLDSTRVNSIANPVNRRHKRDSNTIQPKLAPDIVHTELTKELDPAVLLEEERNRREKEEKLNARASIRETVGVQAGNYKVGVFGGISDLDITVSNRSGYTIDEVLVEVDYLLSSQKVFKTETLHFTGLGPKDAKTLTLPRSGRGVKAQPRIMHIISRELDID